MYKVTSVVLLLFFLSCYTSKIVRDHGECYVRALQFDNKLNDTSKVLFIKSVVFDTTANLVHGYIVENSTYSPIQNAAITLISKNGTIQTYTNSQGEFEIFQDLRDGPWNVYINHPEYVCIYITDVVKTGGQWFYIKLERK